MLKRLRCQETTVQFSDIENISFSKKEFYQNNLQNALTFPPPFGSNVLNISLKESELGKSICTSSCIFRITFNNHDIQPEGKEAYIFLSP